MTISYHWLCEYLPVSLSPEELSQILTSIGLEVESLKPYEEIPGGLQGLLVGEVMACAKHPNAEKLKVTQVSLGEGKIVSIVCGASNVAAGQKVIVAPEGTTIYPTNGEPLLIKKAKIRGEESQGMICAADEVGLGDDHSGILVLDPKEKPGSPVTTIFKPYTDWIFEIGLTPNRMDAMSHMGVARDVCAFLSHRDHKDIRIKIPETLNLTMGNTSLPIDVVIENKEACRRYSGISLVNVTVKESPAWLQQKLKAIGQRPINNIVDVTNYILHETGQPLHAFDTRSIRNNKIIVKNLPAGTRFTTLDQKVRALHADDLVICNGEQEPLCMAGVFGGWESGVSQQTTTLFLESAWFNPIDIRKTSFRHGLRTDAALRFEKNTDISCTTTVLRRAASLICELSGASIASSPVDVYPDPQPRTQISLSLRYLEKVSGKSYPAESVKRILGSLGFEIIRDTKEELITGVPYSKPDITLPADVVEEVMRIDGLDNIAIPSAIRLSPSVEREGYRQVWKEKIAQLLCHIGFHELLTNSITNAAYFTPEELTQAVPLLNNLSADHNLMRPSMLETGLEVIDYNLNRKNLDLLFFEFGKVYHTKGTGHYEEQDQLCLYVTGQRVEADWRTAAQPGDLYYLKGVLSSIFSAVGVTGGNWSVGQQGKLQDVLQLEIQGQVMAFCGRVDNRKQKRFEFKQAVYYAQVDWQTLVGSLKGRALKAQELPRQLPVVRDLAMLVPAQLPYGEVEKTVHNLKIEKLQNVKLFDIFESDKLGKNKKSMAIRFTFLDPLKTLTDGEIEAMMNSLRSALEKNVQAEIRKQ